MQSDKPVIKRYKWKDIKRWGYKQNILQNSFPDPHEWSLEQGTNELGMQLRTKQDLISTAIIFKLSDQQIDFFVSGKVTPFHNRLSHSRWHLNLLKHGKIVSDLKLFSLSLLFTSVAVVLTSLKIWLSICCLSCKTSSALCS